ncbi:acyl-CoA thioesterase II [Quadrisphaera setariae]|uniref:Acyl-CoA thioesterase 2 n=1 Tax=Quadrisphaera setariae TaxID=2593304 RepID=A0A5C8ZIX8_9ACTN|nr:acyl-CoA thioesterase II [Quadrisphaera setariae]
MSDHRTVTGTHRFATGPCWRTPRAVQRPPRPPSLRRVADDVHGAAQAEGLAGLLRVLDLTPSGVDSSGQDLFTGENQRSPHGRVFGGQVLGQSVVAATRTVDPARSVHSMHGYFLRPGDPSTPITFAVERLRDGGSFSARRVHAIQHGQPILSMIASFQEAQDGVDHAEPAPQVPAPEELPSIGDLVGGLDHPFARYWAQERPVDVRHVGSAIYLPSAPGRRDDDGDGSQAVWLRVAGPLPADQALHRAVLAWASDVTILEPVLRRHGAAWATPGGRVASLDHALWWHRPVSADAWMLFVQETPSASGARGLGLARVYDRAGTLVATVAQEGMTRLPPRP